MMKRRLRDGFYPFTLGCVAALVILMITGTIPNINQLQMDSYNLTEICDNNGIALERKYDVEARKFDSIRCKGDQFHQKRLDRRGDFYVMYDFVQAQRTFDCMESITLSAPGDFRFLDNVVPLVEKWQGPISIALYAPGQDFFDTLDAIAYLRVCETSLIKELITFHIFFDTAHIPAMPGNATPLMDTYLDVYDCQVDPPWKSKNDEDLYKIQNKLLYPINVARNVAKLASKTYFVFPSDIELYPTPNFIPKFLHFVETHLTLFHEDKRNVFVLPIFEILENHTIPETKTELQKMFKESTAFLFHKKVCHLCHRVIDGVKWEKAPETEGLAVFSVGKRQGMNLVWEPFYVCTQKEPLWDERMTWEGQSNKMVQAYTLCLLDYDFHVLDNAFLIHKPGVKKKKVQIQKFGNLVKESNKLLKLIARDLQTFHGNNKQCSTTWIKRTANKTENVDQKSP